MNIFDIAKAAIEGVASIPVDLYYAGRRGLEDSGFMGEKTQAANREEYDRVGDIILKAIKERVFIGRVVDIVLSDFTEKLPPDVQSKLAESMAKSGVKFGAKQGAKQFLAGAIAEVLVAKIFTKMVTKRVAKLGVGLAISAALLYGMVERASNASQRLARVNPRLHQKLVAAKVDMLYFMAEDSLAPFVMIETAQLRDPASYDRFVRSLIDAIK